MKETKIKEELGCCMCEAKAEFIRKTQFAGSHPYCEKCAKKEKDFDTEDPSYFTWRKITQS